MQIKSKTKQKMQDVSFRNIDEFLEFLTEDEIKTVNLLRKIIFDCVPNINEKLSYNVPFYKKNKGMFFIWPASVLWGKKKSYSGVRFGFQQGYLLRDDLNILIKGNRKQVYYLDFLNSNDINIAVLKTYIFDAVLVDEQMRK